MYRETEFNCAQSILASFAPGLGMDKETAMKVACGLGSGMGRKGSMCGAVTGGILVLGLKYGMIDGESVHDKEKTYDAVCLLLERVEAIHGSTNCTELMGVDIGTPEGQETAKEKNLSERICSRVVEDVAIILETFT